MLGKQKKAVEAAGISGRGINLDDHSMKYPCNVFMHLYTIAVSEFRANFMFDILVLRL